MQFASIRHCERESTDRCYDGALGGTGRSSGRFTFVKFRNARLTYGALVGAAVLAAACATGGSGAPSQVALPSDIPMPAQATLVLGAQGGGTDANAVMYGFTSNLPPAEARLAYAAELRAAGYLPTGEEAGWFLFRNSAGVVLAISFGSSGPPTGIVVRVLPPGSTPTPAPPAEPSGSLGSAEVPRPDPPHGPPAWASSEGTGNGNARGKGLGDVGEPGLGRRQVRREAVHHGVCVRSAALRAHDKRGLRRHRDVRGQHRLRGRSAAPCRTRGGQHRGPHKCPTPRARVPKLHECEPP